MVTNPFGALTTPTFLVPPLSGEQIAAVLLRRRRILPTASRTPVAPALVINNRTGVAISVMYNPEEYQLDQGNEIAEIGIPGLAASPVQFVRGRARTLRMELFYDTYETGQDVREHTQQIIDLLDPDPATHTPPNLLFLMGGFSFPCVLVDAELHTTMFLADGTPVRARLRVSFREFVRIEVETRQGFFVGPPTLHQIGQRDTLPNLAATYLGDPRRWREIADANELEDPLALPPGAPLVMRPGGNS
jgi:nucleoid-associated protein YgaU